MSKSILKTILLACVFAAFTACSENTENTDVTQESEETSQEISEPEPEVEETEESLLGNLEGLVGQWTVDAATAGVKMDLTFGEDGSFTQAMGPVNQEGTWTKINDEHINVITPNTKAEGQKWKVGNLTEASVDFTWNLDKNPKVIPMTRAK